MHADKSVGTILCLLDYTALMTRLNIKTKKCNLHISTIAKSYLQLQKTQAECAGLDLDCLTLQNLTASE